ncbi:hypothetical protein Agub_g5109, partial [Astrephomene gubernaculifera]
MSSFSLTSDVVNYLIYRYLQEAGFTHSAFTFASESLVTRTNIDPNNVPPGSLVTFIQKGLQYLEIEANLDAQDGEVDGDYKLLTPEELLSNDVDQLRALVAERKEEDSRPKGPPPAEKTKPDREQQQRAREKAEREKAAERSEKAERAERAEKAAAEKAEREREKAASVAAAAAAAAAAASAAVPAPAPAAAAAQPPALAAPAAAPAPPAAPATVAVKSEPRPSSGPSSGPTPMEEDTPPAPGGPPSSAAAPAAAAAATAPPAAPAAGGVSGGSIEVAASSVVTLNGHDSEVYICAWSPVEPLLASGSGDSTARIWNLSTSAAAGGSGRSVVLHHEAKQDKTQGKDVTTLDWNADGSLLATGSYDGLARIWGKDGKLRQTLDKHQGPIFALKWNKRGDLLLSGSVDKTAIVWDAKTGEAKQTFDLHTAPTLDVDWRNSTSFATCSTDKLIHVCKLGESRAVKTYAGHDDEVNAIKWDPSGRLLASCSDDKTAKVWSLSSDKPVQDFRDHQREIYTIRWSPTGPQSANPNMPLLLASASFDTTVRLWDIEAGRAVQCLQKHVEPVYSVAFSPNGKLVATGSFDKCVYVWSVEEGVLVRSFKGEAGIYEVCWNREGTRVAACFAN